MTNNTPKVKHSKEDSLARAYILLDEAVQVMHRLYGLDSLTLGNLVFRNFEESLRKMQGGYIEEPPKYNYITHVGYGEDETTIDFSDGKRATLPNGQGVKTDEYGVSEVNHNELPPTPKENR